MTWLWNYSMKTRKLNQDKKTRGKLEGIVGHRKIFHITFTQNSISLMQCKSVGVLGIWTPKAWGVCIFLNDHHIFPQSIISSCYSTYIDIILSICQYWISTKWWSTDMWVFCFLPMGLRLKKIKPLLLNCICELLDAFQWLSPLRGSLVIIESLPLVMCIVYLPVGKDSLGIPLATISLVIPLLWGWNKT